MSSKKVSKVVIILAYYWIIFGLIWADQVSKNFFLDHSYIEITKWLKAELAFNFGSAFGVPIPITITASVGVIIGVLLLSSPLSKKFYQQRVLERCLWAIIAAGVIGNSIDRIVYGRVIDFIKVGPWPNFNFADTYLTVGVIMLVTMSFFFNKQNSNLS